VTIVPTERSPAESFDKPLPRHPQRGPGAVCSVPGPPYRGVV